MRRLQVILKYLLIVLGVFALIFGVYLLWYYNRPTPLPIHNQTLFNGITYSRDIRAEPRQIIIHAVSIDLSRPDISLMVTPPDNIDGYVYAARTVSTFADEFDAQIAINGDFFDPWFAYLPWHYYPKKGDGVNVRGQVIHDGAEITAGYASQDIFSTLYIYDDHAAFTQERETPQQAISGNVMLLQNGEIVPHPSSSYFDDPHPRTAVGVSEDGTTLFLFVVDGRQPNYSEGITIAELSAVAAEYGAHNALNLDGGGSVTLVARVDDALQVLNSPIHTHIPGRERPVANHLGVFAK